MDIDKNDLQILARTITNILIESSITLLKTYPKASFAWFSLFFSYIFFPLIFLFFIYTIPFILLITAISIKTYIIVHKARDVENHDKAKQDKSPTNLQSAEDASNVIKKYDSKHVRSVRRTAKEVKSPRDVQSAEDSSNVIKKYDSKHARSVRRRRTNVTFDEETKQDSIQEKEAISSIDDVSWDLIDKSELVEATPKDIPEVKEDAVNDGIESSPSDVSLDFRSRFKSLMRSQRFGSGDVDSGGISPANSEDAGDDTRRGKRMASPSTEDRKSDLGLSEIERTKRLENLIARRRARKILSLHFRRAIGNMGSNDSLTHMVYPIEIPKSNTLSPVSDQFTQVPGSAPSVLLPTRNPFDLPYEPHEEKPNLTGDSFDQEIFGTHLKDAVFCRHESFSLGHNSSLHNNHRVKKEILEIQEKTENQPGERDDKNKIEHEQSQEVECYDKVENTDQNFQDQASEQGQNLNDVSHENLQNEEKTKSVIVEDYEDYNGRLSFSSSSEENEPIRRLDKEKILKSLCSPAPTSINIQDGGGCIDDILFHYSSSETEKSRSEHFYDFNHSRIHSLASDMQVEVSEVGSPSQLSDMNISSPDEVRSLNDGKFEKEITDSEDMKIASYQPSRVDENKSRTRDTREVDEEDTIGVEFSIIKEHEIPAERAQDSSKPHSKFVSECNVPGASDAYKDSVENIIHEQPNTSHPNSTHDMKPGVLQPHEEIQLTGTPINDHIHYPDLHSPQVPSLPPSTSTAELDTNLPSSNLQPHNTNNAITVQTLGKEHENSYSHESDEAIDCSRSPENLRAEVENPLEAKDETEKKMLLGTNVIHNEETSETVDDESSLSHNTVNNRIHGEMQNPESGSRSHLQLDGEPNYFQQEHPCSNSEKSDKSGSMLNTDDLLILQNSSQANLITNEEGDINISCKQGGGDLPGPGLAELEEYHRVTAANESTGENSQPNFSREIEEMSEEIPQQLGMPDTMSTEGNYILESTPDTEDDVSSIEIAASEPSLFVIQPNEVVLVPEIQTQQVPTALSTSSSPKSVLHPLFSQGSVSNLSDAVQMENQHSGGESSGSNSSSLPTQNSAPSAEDLTTYHQSHVRSIERVQEPSPSQLASAEEVTSTSGRLISHDIDSNSTDHGQKETSETSFSHTTNQETNLDTISSNEEDTDQLNPSTSRSSELEKG